MRMHFNIKISDFDHDINSDVIDIKISIQFG
jgi:hypothetical protein